MFAFLTSLLIMLRILYLSMKALHMSDTKQQIVLAAFAAIRAEGLPVLSYDRIAEKSQLSRQVLRYHFSDSDDLMVALCDHLATTYREALIARAADLTGPIRIEMFLDFYFGTLEGANKPEDDQVYGALMSRATGSERVRTNLRNQYNLLGQVLSHELQLAYPELGQQPANELSFVFVDLMYGHWKMVASLGVSDTHNRLTRAATARLIEAYVCDPVPVAKDVKVWQV